jgi:hypothetical protein
MWVLLVPDIDSWMFDLSRHTTALQETDILPVPARVT